jgi:hypothetical protein
MNRLVNGNNNYFYASVVGGQGLTSDQVSDTGTGHTLSYDINYLKNNIGGASLTGDITIGTNFSNTISVNSGSTTYNNAEIIKVKDNVTASIRLQCNDAGPTDLMILNTTNGSESMYLPLQYTEIGNVENGGVQIGDGSNAGATNLYGIVSLKNGTDSTNYTSTNCSNVAGGLSVYKKLNVGGSINAVGSIHGSAITSSGNINAYANTIYGGNLNITGTIASGSNTLGNTTDSSGLLTGALQCSGGISVSKKIYTGSGIMLPTVTGTASILNYYEEYTTLVNLWAPSGGGGWLNSTNTMTLIRIGNIVHFKIKAFSGNALGGYIHNSAIIPARFCPSSTTQFPIQCLNLSNNQLGLLSVLSSGYINIYASITGGNFGSGIGSGLLLDTFVSWTMI